MSIKKQSTDTQRIGYRDLLSLLKPLPNPEGKIKSLLFLVGILLTPITLIGSLWFYMRSYRRFSIEGEQPTLANLTPINRVAMLVGAVFIWVLLYVGIKIVMQLMEMVFSRQIADSPVPFILMGINLILCIVIFWMFRKWQQRIYLQKAFGDRFGSARWAKPSELEDLKQDGLYIGGLEYAYKKAGHFLTVAGTRAGKFVNLIAPHLLGISNYKGSTFCIDVKGEISAVTARFQLKIGNRVLILDPWNMNPMGSATYNPLDLVSGQKSSEDMVDSVSMIAEMIVPQNLKGEDFWNSRARSLISGLILHLMTDIPKPEQHLGTIWKFLRLETQEWQDLLSDMAASDNEIVRATANEAVSLMTTSDKTFSSILSTARDKTDFLKSPALRRSLESSTFDVNTLSDGKTTLYVIIPPDQLDAQSQWLRLVFTTALMAVVRNRNQRVTFILDEAAALGYLPQLKTAFSTYAGYNITMWPIFQDLAQIKSIYGDAWETFISNAAIRHFFGVNDEFTSSYLEKLMGTQTILTHEGAVKGSSPNATARPLATADEIRRGSADNIFTFIEQRPPTYFKKLPYYEIPELYDRYDDNPYYKP